MTQEEAARAVGVKQSDVSRWERNLSVPSFPSRAKLLELFEALASAPNPKRRVQVRADVPRGCPPAVRKAAEAYLAEERAPEPVVEAPRADGSPIRRWLSCVRAVRGAAYRAELVDLLRLAGEAGLGLDDVVEAVG